MSPSGLFVFGAMLVWLISSTIFLFSYANDMILVILVSSLFPIFGIIFYAIYKNESQQNYPRVSRD